MNKLEFKALILLLGFRKIKPNVFILERDYIELDNDLDGYPVFISLIDANDNWFTFEEAIKVLEKYYGT